MEAQLTRTQEAPEEVSLEIAYFRLPQAVPQSFGGLNPLQM